jgi:hypothetical protein
MWRYQLQNKGEEHMTKKCICAALTEPECDCGAVDYGEREWVGLTDEDKQIAFDDTQEGGGFWEFADAIEAKLKEKNT